VAAGKWSSLGIEPVEIDIKNARSRRRTDLTRSKLNIIKFLGPGRAGHGVGFGAT
jgi:hypothetical protein